MDRRAQKRAYYYATKRAYAERARMDRIMIHLFKELLDRLRAGATDLPAELRDRMIRLEAERSSDKTAHFKHPVRVNRGRGADAPSTNDLYLATLEAFREFCDSRGLPAKVALADAMRDYAAARGGKLPDPEDLNFQEE